MTAPKTTVFSVSLLINLLWAGCSAPPVREPFSDEADLKRFLLAEGVDTRGAFVMFLFHTDCPCAREAAAHLAEYGEYASQGYLFSLKDLSDMAEIESFGFKEKRIYPEEHYERMGLNIASPKLFLFKNGEITEWENF